MKTGLGESYDKVQFLNKKTRAYIDLTKPISSVGAGIAFLLASVFYFYYTGQQHLIPDYYMDIIYASATILFAHSASQVMNQAEDAEMDSETEHKQNRPIPAGIVSVDEARSLAWILSAFAFARAFMVHWQFGIMVSIMLGMGIFYNLNPIRAKERIISIPWQAVSRGLLPFPTVWSAFGNPLDPTPWALGVFMFFYVLGFQNSADILDRHVDEKYGVRTFVVEFGVRGTTNIALACMFAMVLSLGGAIEFELLPYDYVWMLSVMPFTVVMWLHMRLNPYTVSERTGNHPAWAWFYFGLVLCVLTPLIIEVLG